MRRSDEDHHPGRGALAPRARAERSILRTLHHVVFHASREGRAAEIAGWSNAVTAFAGGGAAAWVLGSRAGVSLAASAVVGIALAVVLFVALRLSLTNRRTIWAAAALGTLSVATAAGTVAWVFSHLLEGVAVAPPLFAAAAALSAGATAGWAYRRLARLREDDVPDSLLEPVSVPRSR